MCCFQEVTHFTGLGSGLSALKATGGCSQLAHSLVTLLPIPLGCIFFLFMCKVYSNLQIPNYSEVSVERNSPDIKKFIVREVEE